MQAVVSRDDPDVDSAVSWSAYHARLQPEDAVSGSDVALASLLPLFSEEAKSVAMIRHSMDVVKKSVEILNPGQIPIITVDQPLFAVAKHPWESRLSTESLTRDTHAPCSPGHRQQSIPPPSASIRRSHRRPWRRRCQTP